MKKQISFVITPLIKQILNQYEEKYGKFQSTSHIFQHALTNLMDMNSDSSYPVASNTYKELIDRFSSSIDNPELADNAPTSLMIDAESLDFAKDFFIASHPGSSFPRIKYVLLFVVLCLLFDDALCKESKSDNYQSFLDKQPIMLNPFTFVKRFTDLIDWAASGDADAMEAAINIQNILLNCRFLGSYELPSDRLTERWQK